MFSILSGDKKSMEKFNMKKRKRENVSSTKTLLLRAVKDNDITLLNDILDELSIDSVIMSGMTALHFAVRACNTQMVSFLLSRDADTNIGDENGLTPLHIAAAEGHLEIVNMLLNSGAQINERDCDQFSALHMSAQYNYIDLVQLLIERGADPYLEDIEGTTALHLAMYNNNINIASLLINIMDRDFVESNIGLHTAAESGHNEMVKLFLNFFPDINALSFTAMNNEGVTALTIAIKGGFTEIARFLIENGALFFRSGYDEISIAVKNEDINMVKLLLEKGINANQVSENGVSLLHIAINNLDLDLASLLIESGADLNRLYKNKTPTLQLAIRVESLEISKLLLENGANPNELDSRGFTSLHLAAAKGYTPIASLLLWYNASIEHPNYQGITALRIASLREQHGVINLLIENGANVYDSHNNIAFGGLAEDSRNIYSFLYNTYLASSNFYQQNLRTEDEKFINSVDFCKSYVNKVILEMTATSTEAAEVFKCATNDLLVFKKLKNILPLLDKIISYLTISELKKITASYTNALNEMIQALKIEGYIVQDVEKDGNCFFRAAALALDQPESSHTALRSRVATYISENQQEFTDFSENLYNYVSDLERPGEWVDNIAIQAFADEINVNINIIRTYPSEGIIQITPRNSIAEHNIRLLYTGNHYMAVTALHQIDLNPHEQELNTDTSFAEAYLDYDSLLNQDSVAQEITLPFIGCAGMILFDK